MTPQDAVDKLMRQFFAFVIEYIDAGPNRGPEMEQQAARWKCAITSTLPAI